jgi:hypothetical protein
VRAGLLGGSAAGIWLDRDKRVPGMNLKLKANSYINSMGRTGSLWGNGFGCTGKQHDPASSYEGSSKLIILRV